MIQNTGTLGDEMFTAKLVRNMPITSYAHWSEYINSPTAVTSIPSVETMDGTHYNVAPSAPDEQGKQALTSGDGVSQQKELATTLPPAKAVLPVLPSLDVEPQSKLLGAKETFELVVKVLEADGIALGPRGLPPKCTANVRLIFPDEISDHPPDTVLANIVGHKYHFEQRNLNYKVESDKVEHTQVT